MAEDRLRVEIGCGPLGGFVPMLRSVGYAATGVDPEAPAGPWYQRVEFERYEMAEPAEAVLACTSLHHVADLGEVLNLVGTALVSGGSLVVVEWAQERFDEATPGGALTGFLSPRTIPAGCSSAVTSGAPRACPGMVTAGPGRRTRACTLARTSCASSTPGSTASCSLTVPISSPTWPTSAKRQNRLRLTPGRSRPTASATWAGGAKEGTFAGLDGYSCSPRLGWSGDVSPRRNGGSRSGDAGGRVRSSC